MARSRFSFVCAALLLLAPAALAQPAPPSSPPGPPQPHDLVREHAVALGIDAATVERIQAIAEGSHEQRDSLQAAVLRAREDLATLLRADRPDRAAVLAQVDALGAAETALLRHSLTTLLDMHALLTPEQVKALEAMAPRPPEGGPSGGPGGGPPGGPPPGFPPGPPPGK